MVAPGDNDSHSDLLESIGIEDDYLGASKTFVRAELVPDNDEWWISPEAEPKKWKFIVDQDITPDWFDRNEHEKIFREAVCEWWKAHVLVDQKIDELSSGYYRLKRCEVKKLCNEVKVLLDESKAGTMRGSSQVGEMRGSSRVGEMWESSRVGTMWGSSQVGEMRESSRVGTMRESSRVGTMRGSSQVGEMWGSSQVGTMRESSRVGTMWGSSQVGTMRGSSQVGTMRGSSQVGTMWGSSQVGEMWESSTARDYKNYPNIKIWVSPEGKFEMIAHKNEK